ncbi:ABC transporter substrate-binding protein [Moraxella oblonga]|uniref:ABC transporter substrate-binding protein n=1 Tax=Moraxella oblonga TaxID=200413 RepID=UPI00082C7118|nr:ABC transporter substrate-binding protein [Moraxella oblonga]
MKLHHLSALVLATAILFGCGGDKASPVESAKDASTQTDKAPKSVAISAIVEHPSLDDIRKGVVHGLGEAGYKDGENLIINFQSAQGNMATAGQIAKQFASENHDAIVAITTPTAQNIVAVTQNIPVIYTAVSDPVAAKLINEQGVANQPNVTGLSSELPLEPQIELFTKIKPNAKRIGYVYSSGEANSVSLRERLAVELPKHGMTLVDVPANRSSDVANATRSLVGKVDLLYTSMDNGVASAMEAMVGVANEIDVPIVTSDEFSVRRGASAGLGVNDFDFGVTTAKMVAQILDGAKPADIKPQVMNTLTLYVSPKHASEQGIAISDELLQNAVNVDSTPAK